ncbi:alpha/beta hydrolase [Vulgatibacter incomptus]|uniref:Putative esterase/lipase n=1 Tax=Vulgatibacter incomptus TaxID=1391653 RepID=A0A0K1PFI7_9BACT|nr:alpha/beta fold hydrolase [Vulgatibacter incomptus]AKU92293.1 putative esterase/lipase [Vulgatibacter incomptus]
MNEFSTDPFSLGEGDDGVLLLHGFSGSPFELRPLAEALAEGGFRCLCPLLPGHGRDWERLAHVGENEWLAVADEALEGLRAAGCKRLFVVGFSMGGALAIRLASGRGRSIAGLALLAPALSLHGSSQLYRSIFRQRWATRLWPWVSKGAGDIQDRNVVIPGPPRIPTSAASTLDRVIRGAHEALPGVETPAIVLWGAHDRVVPRSAARVAAERIGSGPARLVVLPRSAHQLALDYDRLTVATEVAGFFGQISGRDDGEGLHPRD